MEEKIGIVKNQIEIDKDELKRIIIEEWQSGNLFEMFYSHGFRGEDLFFLF